VRGARRLGRAFGIDHELSNAGLVPQVDEDQPAVVAAPGRPAGERQGLADMPRSELARSEVSPAH
jgi:hypothetical protein